MLVRPNATKAKLARGEVVVGVFVAIAAPALVELCGTAGFDYVLIDAEHGPIDVSECENLVRAADAVGITPLVRVPSHEPKTILRYLDTGAQGIMAPNVSSASSARGVVRATRYAPLGERGLGPGRAAGFGQEMSLAEYARHANENLLLIAQLEHIDALTNLSEILDVDGIDAFEIGLADLSQSMGLPGQTSHPEVQGVVDKLVAGVLGAGRVIGDSAADRASAASLIEQGYRMIDTGFTGVATRALKGLVVEIRKAAAPASG
jgi:2-keto-3-deoxy-L-rhamnonate aldolase RhmA